MGSLLDEKDKQIAIIKGQKTVAEEKCQNLETMVRKANGRINMLVR